MTEDWTDRQFVDVPKGDTPPPGAEAIDAEFLMALQVSLRAKLNIAEGDARFVDPTELGAALADYLTQTAGDTRWVNESDHTRSQHESLGLYGPANPPTPPAKSAHPLFFSIPATAAAAFGAANEFRGVFAYLPYRVTFNRLRIRVQTNGGVGNVSAAVYSPDGQTRYATTGAVATPAVGNADLTVPETTLNPGVYLFGASCDSTSPTFATMNVPQFVGVTAFSSSHPAPATLAVGTTGLAGNVPCVGLLHV